MQSCSETKRVTTWTPWLLANDTDVGRIERRFRFSCRAPVDSTLLKVGAMKLEERICHADGTCLRTGTPNKEKNVNQSMVLAPMEPKGSSPVECRGARP